jgi:histone-arginine methyltransferase CARM1
MLSDPIAVNKGQSVSGSLHFIANDKFSYYIDMDIQLDGTNIRSRNRINLHDQMYHYLNSTS